LTPLPVKPDVQLHTTERSNDDRTVGIQGCRFTERNCGHSRHIGRIDASYQE
jgi:hypothetical protein